MIQINEEDLVIDLYLCPDGMYREFSEAIYWVPSSRDRRLLSDNSTCRGASPILRKARPLLTGGEGNVTATIGG